MSSNQQVDNLKPLHRESYQLSPGMRQFQWVKGPHNARGESPLKAGTRNERAL